MSNWTETLHIARTNKLILLVEDNRINQVVTKEMLDRQGYAVDIATNGHDAVAALTQHAYDLVLMDCQMPGLDGLDATRIIRQNEAEQVRKHVPIIALTANAMQGDRERCLAAGMDDYLSKPFTQEKLGQMLQQWLARAAAPQQGSSTPKP